MFSVKLVKNDGSKVIGIAPIVNKLSWDSDLSLKSVMEFGINWGDARYLPYNPVELGDLAILYAGDKEVNRGIIVTEKRKGRDSVAYTAYDYAWYLSKSKSVYQFNGISVSKAIKKILSDFGIPIGSMASMQAIVSKVYIQKSPAEIMTDLLKMHEQQTGQRMNTELRQGQLYIEKMEDMEFIGTFKLASNIAPNNVLDNPLGAERTRTIEDMRNQVKIILSKNDNYETVALAQDVNTGSKYGLLEEVFKIDEEDVAKARQVSKILLERLNKIHESNKISLMGDPKFKAGKIFNLYEPVTKMQGRYMITNCSHNVEGGYHVMDLVLTLPEDIG